MEIIQKAIAKEILKAWLLADEWLNASSRPWEDVYEDMHFNPLAIALLKFAERRPR